MLDSKALTYSSFVVTKMNGTGVPKLKSVTLILSLICVVVLIINYALFRQFCKVCNSYAFQITM